VNKCGTCISLFVSGIFALVSWVLTSGKWIKDTTL